MNVTRIDGFIRSALRAVDGMEDAMIVVFFRLNVMLVVKMVGKLGMSHMVVLMVVVGGMRIVVRQIILHFVCQRRKGMIVAIGMSIFVRKGMKHSMIVEIDGRNVVLVIELMLKLRVRVMLNRVRIVTVVSTAVEVLFAAVLGAIS